MRKKILKLATIAFYVSTVFYACGPKHNFTLTGEINGGAGKMIYFNKLLTNGQQPVDSAKLDKKGGFQFEGNIGSPTFYLLKFSDRNFATLLIDSTEKVNVTGSYKQFAADYKIKGSFNSTLISDLNSQFIKVKSSMDSLRELYQKHQYDQGYISELEKINNEYTGAGNKFSSYLNEFVKKNPFSMASVFALYQKWDADTYIVNDFQTMKTAASALYSIYPKNEHVKALYNNALSILKQQNNQKLSEMMASYAVNSPNITLPDPSGINRQLWALHGKNVLLHFWSAKDRTSRIQNQVLVELYSKYRNRGFEIFMVSVDNDKEAWTRAISEDGLTWINVGDMKGSVQALLNYNVHTVPSNYLLDKEGKIITKNLKGPELGKALAELL